MSDLPIAATLPTTTAPVTAPIATRRRGVNWHTMFYKTKEVIVIEDTPLLPPAQCTRSKRKHLQEEEQPVANKRRQVASPAASLNYPCTDDKDGQPVVRANFILKGGRCKDTPPLFPAQCTLSKRKHLQEEEQPVANKRRQVASPAASLNYPWIDDKDGHPVFRDNYVLKGRCEDTPPLPPAQCTRSKLKHLQEEQPVASQGRQVKQSAEPPAASLNYPCTDDKDGHPVLRDSYVLKGRCEDTPPLPPAQCTRSKRKHLQEEEQPVASKRRQVAPPAASLNYPCTDDKDGHPVFRDNYVLKGRCEDTPPLPPTQCTRSKLKHLQEEEQPVASEGRQVAPPAASLDYPCIDDEDGHLVFRANYVLKDRYKAVAELGKGSFGQVFKCKDLLFGGYVAVKVIRSTPEYREASKIEIRVLETLKKHDPTNQYQCVQLRSTFNHYDHVCMVFDLLDQSVFDFLEYNNFHPFPLAHVQDMARQILHSVAYLHDQNLVHTDLKPENIMLVNSASRTTCVGTIKNGRIQGWDEQVLRSTEIQLIDFGSATFEDEHHSSIVSTRHYRAPEIILGTGWSYPCDIWSIGCVLVELFTGDALFQTHEDLEHLAMMEVVLGKIPTHILRNATSDAKKYFATNGWTRYPDKSTGFKSSEYFEETKPLAEIIRPTTEYTRLFLDLLRKMLMYDPNERITPKQALNHPFLNTRFNFFGHVVKPTPPLSSTEEPQ